MEGASFISGTAAGENDAENITSEAHNSSDVQNLDRQPQSSSGLSYTVDSDADIKVEGVYEIDHEEVLPLRTPIHLKKIRVVIVSEKTKLNVTVKFPSILSLRNYFSANSCAKSGSMEHPLLDEEFVMGTNLAGRVLHRKVPSLEFAQNKHLQGFWMISPMTQLVKAEVVPASTSPLTTTSTGLLTWGMRRKVRFLGRHRERPPSLCILKAQGGAEVTEVAKETRALKRRREANSVDTKGKKKSRDKEKTKTNSKERWSKERYDAAEQKLLEILREQGAFLGNPILRPALRMEARKHIGDTGLLDHLLKHMAGMVNEERGERLRRCHNAEGQMEYWLERADLDELRKQAGVKDPYWVPPPGWNPGDSPYLDPETSNQLKQLREYVGCMRR
ncbi:protein AMEIOTIC 1-like [Aristolochia californica]|uniref:protein AMEIOTIC 1-like n=1 Tax=Aristolochia californica TaxID=171875 RepID=UPI0035E10917